MIVFLTVSVVVLIGLVVAVVLARVGGADVHLAPPVSSSGGRPLADGEVTSASLSRVRFDRAPRGYRMDQVDEVLDRMRATLAAYENGVGPASFADLDDAGSWERVARPRRPPGD